MQVLRVEDRILRERVKIMGDERFVAIVGILMIGEWGVKDSPNLTAITNGRDVYFGRKYVEGLNDPMTRFLILHEYWHIWMQHLLNWKHLWDENPKLANIAADMVVNYSLLKMAGSDGFIEMPPGGCYDPKYTHEWDVQMVFEDLKKQGGKGKGGGGKGQPQKGQGQGQPQPGDGEGFDEHDWEGAQTSELTKEEVKELQGQIDTALRQGAQLAGKLGGNVDRSVTDLLKVEVPWEEVLQEWVKTQMAGTDLSTWRRPHRRWMTRDLYMPSRYTETAKRITIGVDTSGSIGVEQLRRALSEIKGACDTVKPETVDVIYWDHDVAGHEIYENDAVENLVNTTKPKGGGGTRVGSMKEYLNREGIVPDCIVIFTDGYVESDWSGESGWPAPVLWCVSTKGVTAPYGKTLYVPA